MALTSKLVDIADAIRAKTGKSDKMLLADMPDEITGIETGDEIDYDALPVTVVEDTTLPSYTRYPDAVRLELPNLKSIPYGFCTGCDKLVMVVAPNVTNVGYESFCGCYNLKRLDFASYTASNSSESFLGVRLRVLNNPKLSSFSRGNINWCELGGKLSYPKCTVVAALGLAQSGIESIDLPACTKVGEQGFAGSRVRSVNLPACTYADVKAFWGSALESVDLPACTTIKWNVFEFCCKLKSVSLPVCTVIESYDFRCCYALESVDLPACTVLNQQAFNQCYSLVSVNLPVCTTVGYYAFESTALEFIDLPACTELQTGAFRFSASLATIVLRSETLCTLSYDVFTSCTSLASVYVPDALVDEYKAATNWTAYADKIKPLSEYEG